MKKMAQYRIIAYVLAWPRADSSHCMLDTSNIFSCLIESNLVEMEANPTLIPLR